MDTDMNNLGPLFRLLVPASIASPSDTPSINLCGERWVVVDFASVTEAPPYTCISYSWGTGKAKHPFHAGQEMSDRTIPAIEATIRACHPQAIWIDALCVPPLDPLRTECLQSMGAIYSSAYEVFGVLSEACSKVFQQIMDSGLIDHDSLFALENDEWVTRAWTYQEIVNSKCLNFITLPGNGLSIPGLEFLNAVLWATTEYKRINNIDPFSWAIQHPRFHSLEDLIADYLVVDFAERSAFQVMSVMHRRISQRPEDYFYAMVGAIKSYSTNFSNSHAMDPAEYFIQVCEAKGDYSFIYGIVPRCLLPGKCWRPIIGQLRPVLSGILVAGKGLAGNQQATYLQLENICVLSRGLANLDDLKTTTEFLLPKDKNYFSTKEMADVIYIRIKQLGFSGCGEYIELCDGIFFPQSPIVPSEDLFVAISPDVRWVDGAPALLVRLRSSGICELCDVGVFIGRVPASGEPIRIA